MLIGNSRVGGGGKLCCQHLSLFHFLPIFQGSSVFFPQGPSTLLQAFPFTTISRPRSEYEYCPIWCKSPLLLVSGSSAKYGGHAINWLLLVKLCKV